MPLPLNIAFWKTAPFVRLLAPFVVGIVAQWYLQCRVWYIISSLGCCCIAFVLFVCLPLWQKFFLKHIQGVLLQLVILLAAMLITWNKDAKQHTNWYGNHYKQGDYIIASIKEPLVEKTKSYKADAYIEQLIRNDSLIAGEGKLLVYFSKDSTAPGLQYGNRILINKKLIAIKNSGNPGAFNYQRYAAFQQTFHNVFLKPGDWKKLDGNTASWFNSFLFSARASILATLQTNITAGKNELGIAKALLIGYTNDLDKDLVQAYSNTGVVHIIAISGMHLGLIYGLLLWLFTKLPVINKSKTMQAILIVGCLWLFSLLTGGAASVIRSAVMFTCITGGTLFFKQASIFNSLAASAFVMLCYNPYYLWDVGFQLSYLAVVGIVLFQQPIYNCLYIKNKYLDIVWKAASLTTAAQLLTFPICLYYFHQFPLLFLLTNLIAVPLSTIILYVEILLVALSGIPVLATIAGAITGWLLGLMNKVIVWINDLPFAVWDKIPATIASTWLLYATVFYLAAWLLYKNKNMLLCSLVSCLAFIVQHGANAWQVTHQRKLIVYNVPKYQAIDFVTGNQYFFVGDSILLQDGLLQNFHLKPGRIALQLTDKVDSMDACFNKKDFYQFGNKKLAVIKEPLAFNRAQQVSVDYIVLSKNPRLHIGQLATNFNCSKFIFDASNSLWKIEKWKQDCDRLHLQYHSIPEQGAFVTDW